MRSTTRPVGGMLFLAAAATGLWLARAGDEPALPGGAERVPWTTSRITGSPDPPPPYRVERAFGHLSFKNPLLITHLPGSGRLFVGEQAGRIYSFPNDPACKKPDLFIDLDAELKSIDRAKSPGVAALYGLAFHPKFAENRYCYICYVLKPPRGGPELPDGTRVSRFKVTDTDPPRCDPASEQVLLTFLAGGHNGGCLKFGPDGYLYISTGDATSPNPPDALDTGQDLTDLLSSILRIDVDRHENGKPYAVPADNPFVRTPGVRPEIWAYGFRNPWKMSFDRVTGELWAGDVGWELWEMVYRVEKGGNYGWPVVEGRQPVKPEGKRGPTPILPPTLEYPHTEAASITGGFVYRGKRLPDLYGAYVCGDYVTRKLWAAKFEEGRLLWHKEIAQSNVQIVAFGEDEAGELYFLDYVEDGGIYRLEPNPIDPDKLPRFPRKLSETGLFASVAEHRVAPGVYPFAVNAEQWMDHATAERFVALPGTTTARFHEHPRDLPGSTFRGRVHFPKDGVLVKTIALETEAGNPASRRRLETQVLHFDGDNWRGYSYRWNDEQTDAELVPADGAEQTFAVRDPSAPGGVREQTWHFHARAECLRCHNPWADYGLAFTLPQLDRPAAGAATADQLDALRRLKLIELPEKWDRTRNPRLTDPRAVAADLGARARSYLHVNCAHCHQFGAGGSADIDLHFARPLDQTKTLDVRPVQGAFDIPDARIIAPGDPYRSVLYYRMAKLGGGRMPHIGSEWVDADGLRLVRDWVKSLPGRADEAAQIERLRTRTGGRQRDERAEIIRGLLARPDSALRLADALGAGGFPPAVRAEVLAAAKAQPNPAVRDLFERFLPAAERVRRLGTAVRPEAILRLRGDAARGRELFFATSRTQCLNCHAVAGQGVAVGPDISQIGKKLTREQLLESLLFPSKTIDPAFRSYRAETADGRAISGLLAEKSPQRVVLKDAQGKEVRIPAAEVESLAPLPTSLMPEQLLRDLTAQEAADLIEYLSSLR